jgi:maleate isomerase
LDLTGIVRTLLATTGASRATVRLDVAGMSFPVVAEAVVPGVRAIGGNNTIDQRKVATVRYLLETHEMLIQTDLETAEPAPPRALLDLYETRAQMLSPILRGEQLIGYISVHQCGGAREWAAADIRALRTATEEVSAYFVG